MLKPGFTTRLFSYGRLILPAHTGCDMSRAFPTHAMSPPSWCTSGARRAFVVQRNTSSTFLAFGERITLRASIPNSQMFRRICGSTRALPACMPLELPSYVFRRQRAVLSITPSNPTSGPALAAGTCPGQFVCPHELRPWHYPTILTFWAF